MNTLIAQSFLQVKADRDALLSALKDLVDAVHGGGFPHRAITDAQSIIKRCEERKGTNT